MVIQFIFSINIEWHFLGLLIVILILIVIIVVVSVIIYFIYFRGGNSFVKLIPARDQVVEEEEVEVEAEVEVEVVIKSHLVMRLNIARICVSSPLTDR